MPHERRRSYQEICRTNNMIITASKLTGGSFTDTASDKFIIAVAVPL
jgi:hypothetical protein